jgi:hypothetical protein
VSQVVTVNAQPAPGDLQSRVFMVHSDMALITFDAAVSAPWALSGKRLTQGI